MKQLYAILNKYIIFETRSCLPTFKTENPVIYVTGFFV